MKKILSGTVAAIALIAVATPAAAQTNPTNQRHYAGTGTVNVPFIGPVTISGTDTNPSNFVAGLYDDYVLPAGVGTRYRAQADAPSDSETATPTVNVAFNLSGTVNKDCSFYSGNGASATNISFGVIGVRTGNNENVNSAFEMVGPAEANIDTLTAGCNFNNEVVITKNNGTNGLVNSAAGGYDTNQFQANIPYSVNATWTGVALNAVTTGSGQSLNVSTTQNNNLISQGAWRSRMDIDIVAPAVTSKGLVAGTYSGTTTLTLRAL
ncbi:MULTISPECIES: hypothetical protein [unclassified Sphingopyxis]|uniref:hypothetical protein n=1 Tax=unclassified Sphingopyxis TaxID=2614943 RepID=UPI00073132B2|nr:MULTISPECIES: hypothetical protein [unclassified Sphingopyxis]KTE01403.1 hypothetical protein ATE78_14440 [Sphingopyxis sp. H012]KTE07498.1 hypothetical protein ATE76_17000 [Sphingopyxis sp. H093]KTE12670.1 hypothetical protein ATE70_05350 [Sphingopyxis sp. H053]KTE24263.1 hypothetical protein ATE75_18060 [Sphingopyxis sp. H080]KTE31925.1 hypothetical protein ATE68_20445 [Sphingopyxis sp. H038]